MVNLFQQRHGDQAVILNLEDNFLVAVEDQVKVDHQDQEIHLMTLH